MKVKNTALLARRALIVQEFGEAAWEEWTRQMSTRFPLLAQPLVATNCEPVESFLQINEAAVERFYRVQKNAYWHMGTASALWALGGPYKRFVEERRLEEFVQSLPAVWTTYYVETSSYAKAELDNRVVHVRLLDLEMYHPYFEFLTMGYVQQGLEMISARRAIAKCVLGGPSARKEIYYRFYV